MESRSMGLKTLIFQELLDNHPFLPTLLNSQQAELIAVAGGRDALAAVQEQSPKLVILDAAMPQMSGIECCRQIKEGELVPRIKIVLVSAISSSTMLDRARDAGADLVVAAEKFEEQGAPFIKEVFSADSPKSKATAPVAGASAAPSSTAGSDAWRGSTRVSLTSTIQFVAEGTLRTGSLINLSKTGALFAVESELSSGTDLLLKIPGADGAPIEINAKVVRSVRLKEPKGNMAFAAGGKFSALDPQILEKLDNLIQSRASGVPAGPVLEPEFVRRVMESGPDMIRSVVVGGAGDPPLSELIGEVRPFEQTAFSQEQGGAGDVYSCVRRMVMLRVQFNAFRFFVPNIRANSRILSEPFLPLIRPVLDQASAIEDESVGHVRQAVENEDADTRQGINEASNRMDQAKVAMIMAIADQIHTENLSESTVALVNEMKQKAQVIRDSMKGTQEDLSYGKKLPPPPPIEDKKKKPIPKAKVITLVSIIVVFFGGGAAIKIFGSRVPTADMGITLVVTKAKKTESGLELFVPWTSWDNQSPEEKATTFKQLEAYLQKENLTQAKIFDAEERMIAVMMSSRMGRKRIYTTREFR